MTILKVIMIYPPILWSVNDTNPEKILKIIHKEEEERLPAWDRSINVWFEDYDEHCKEKERSKAPGT